MYCTLNDVKTYLSITAADDDALISVLINSAQAAIDAHCSRTFEATEDETKYLDAAADVDGRTLLLSHVGDIAAITSVTNGDGSTIASSHYVTEPRNSTPYYAIRLLASYGDSWTYTSDPENAITIVGKWAYSATAPDDIAQACKRLSVWLYRQKDTTADEDRPLIAGDGTIVMPAAMPRDVVSALRPYRKHL